MSELDEVSMVLNGLPLPGMDGYVRIHAIEEVPKCIGGSKTGPFGAIPVERRLSSQAVVEEPINKVLWQVGVIHEASQPELVSTSERIPDIGEGDVVCR